MDDFYGMCGSWSGEEIVECGLAEAELHRKLNAQPITAVQRTTTSTAAAGQWKPKMKTIRLEDALQIHHMNEEQAPHQCKRCPARFSRRNTLFAHLRSTNHYMADAEEEPTPNDPTAEYDPQIVKSTAPKTFGTGYSFRTYNYLEVQVRLTKFGPDNWICLDTGARRSLIDRDWLALVCPNAMVLTRASEVSVRGIDNRLQTTTNYVVLQVLMPGHDKSNDQVSLAEIRRE
jgi:hypothetical protein